MTDRSEHIPPTAPLISRSLEHDGFDVRTVPDCAAALAAVQEFHPRLVISNATSCGADGIDLHRSLQTYAAPILLLTMRDVLYNRDAMLDRARPLLCRPHPENGARPLVERLDVPVADVNRRTAPKRPVIFALASLPTNDFAVSGSLAQPALALNPAVPDIYVNGHAANLTPTEFNIMSHLVCASGSVVTYDSLLERIWGAPYRGERHLLQVHMQRLRLKLESVGAPRDIIRNRRGVGYSVAAAVAEETPAWTAPPERQLAG